LKFILQKLHIYIEMRSKKNAKYKKTTKNGGTFAKKVKKSKKCKVGVESAN